MRRRRGLSSAAHNADTNVKLAERARDSRVELRRALPAFVGSLVVLVALFSLVGVEDVAAALVDADRRALVGAFVAVIGAILVWGLSLHVALGILGLSVAVKRSVLLFVATTFVNNVTPLGQVGGDPLNGLLAAWVAESDYERGLAAVVGLNTLNNVLAVSFAVLGFGYVAGGALGYADLAALAVVLAGGVVIGWRYRVRLATWVVTALTPLVRAVWWVLPGRSPPDRSAVERRVERFVGALEQLVGNPRRLSVVAVLSVVGQCCVSACLWFSLYAVGETAPVAVVLFIRPVARIGSIAPTPGGLAGFEVVLVGVLVAALGVGLPAATAAVLIYRAATYWFPLVLGGGVTASIVAARA